MPKSSSVKPVIVRPEAFVFCERKSGAMSFQVKATPEGMVPVEWAAGLLAMHCVVRGQQPCDYRVLVVPYDGLPDSVSRRAQELLEASQTTIGCRAQVTPREREVLRCVLRHQSNKEIGSQLHLSERTVKFHVSKLLAKYNARDRIDLMGKATAGLLPASTAPAESLFGFPVQPEREPGGMRRSSDARPLLPLLRVVPAS